MNEKYPIEASNTFTFFNEAHLEVLPRSLHRQYTPHAGAYKYDYIRKIDCQKIEISNIKHRNKMDLHERYMHIPTTDLSILELVETAFKDDPFLLLHRLIRHYHTEITKNNLDVTKLQTFRILLCYEYQLTFNSGKKHTGITSNDLCFKRIENISFTRKELQRPPELPILYDIILLHIILYCNKQCIEQHLVNFQKLNAELLCNNESRNFYMKIMECFLESLHLRQFLCNDIDLNLMKQFTLMYLKDIRTWLEMKENKEWQSFASIFPKLINTFGFENILPAIWDFVLNNVEDLKDILSALSIITDTCFSINLKDISLTHYNLCYIKQLWLLIIESLRSPIQQYRKQALFIMKRITNFMNAVDKNIVKQEKSVGVPFVCHQSIKTQLPINDVRQKFFLVMEALEEKQYHLIAPALTHIPNLIKGNEEHALCNDCFNSAWLQLIFERILQHENNTIVKQGILYICKLHTIVHDQQFLKLFIHALNNTFLYECQSYQEAPEILNHVVTLFIHAKEEKADFINKLLTVMNEEVWAPIPMFYVMHILRIVSNRTSSHWKNDELNIVKSLVQKNLNMHSHILRIASQIELLNTISLSVEKINDLKIIVDTLLEFPPEEALARGSYSWNIITAWLKSVLMETDAVNFVRLVCDEYSHQGTQSRISPIKFAFMIAMLHDAELILQHKSQFAEETLNNWLSLLTGVNMRPYANMTHISYAIEFMSHLLNLSAKEISKSITQLLSLHINDALKFLLTNSKNILFKFNYEEVNKYLTTIVSFLNNGHLILSKKEVSSYAEKFRNESIFILENMKQYKSMHCMYALHILHYTQNGFGVNPTSFYIQPLLDTSNIQISDINEDQTNSKGKIVSNCYILLAKLTHQYLSKLETDLWSEKINYFKNVSALYEMGGTEIVPEVALILKLIVEKRAIKNLEDKLNLESIFTTCWTSTLLSTKNKLYFEAIKNLIGVIINNNFLMLPNAITFVNQFVDQLLKEGKNTPKLKKILLNEMSSLNESCLRQLQKPLLSCLLHGHVLRKDKQIENQVYLYIAKNYKDCYPQHMSIVNHNSDASIRALSVELLHKTNNADIEYASMFFPIILQKLEKYKNKRYFNHSYIHKIKHRILQILLILQPTLNKLDTVLLQELLCSLIILESNQHSVRIMQEWILIRIFVENTDLHDKLWKFFEEGIATRPGCVSSIACIVYHVSKLLPNDIQPNFVQISVKYIARCCLGQNYNMRLYSQVIFVKLYQMLEEFNCNHVTSQYKGLYDAVIESLKDGNSMKNSSRVQNDFYLSIFHPMKDYSLQTIYFELPRLTGMDTTEWITPDLFKLLNLKQTNVHALQIYNLNTLLSDTKTSPYVIKSTADAESPTKEPTLNLQELSDIQKKINPSISINLSCNEIFSTVRETILQKRILSNEEGIIVVASLIDRAPNLGGLARTCEIFKVKELVIGNLSQTRDKEFQNLSVSSENWITITEVKPHNLSQYILDKRDMGWCVVGVEQTANSTNLLNMQFQKRTVLILGNEKDGISANLIPLFDTCIEIPQLGVTRSLNVHVSGAICIWQYAKQHMLT